MDEVKVFDEEIPKVSYDSGGKMDVPNPEVVAPN